MPLDEGLPEEFAEYLKGAIAYHRNRFPVAREAWKKAAEPSFLKTALSVHMGSLHAGSDASGQGSR